MDKIITCPNCGVQYNVERIEENNINCLRCNFNYHQGFNSQNMPNWVYKMAYNIKNYGK